MWRRWLRLLAGAADGSGACYSYGPRGASTVRAYVHGPRAPATLLRMPLMLAAATAAADRALATFK